jgi:agmatine deiminase
VTKEASWLADPDWEHNCVYLADLLKDRHSVLFAGLRRILTDHDVDVRMLDKVRDHWLRDFCPIQVGPENLVKFRYDPDYLRDEPGLKTGDSIVKSFRDLGRCRRSSIVLDGGNIVASRTKAILTGKIYKENLGWNRAELRDKLQALLQVDQLIVIPQEPLDPIGHSDAIVRFIDEQSVLVNDYTAVDPRFGERLFKVLRRNKLAIEVVPYCPEERSRAGIPSAVGCFTNFLRTERVLVSPIFGTEHDEVALRKLESIFPGLPIFPLDCTDLAREGGVLNCVSASFRISTKTC